MIERLNVNKLKRKGTNRSGKYILLGTVVVLVILSAFGIQIGFRKYRSANMTRISGQYFCGGTEQGLIAGVGTLTIKDNGSFEFAGMYAPSTTGTLYWLNDIQLATREETDFAVITVDNSMTNMLNIQLEEGLVYSHADTGYMNCNLYQP
jgi:hypothetical protein